MEESRALNNWEARQILQRHWDASFRSRARKAAIGVGMVLSIPLMLLLLPVAYVVGATRKLFQKRRRSRDARQVEDRDGFRYSRPTVLFRRASPDSPQHQSWLISLSKDFMKQIRSIDRKLQCRVLDAIAEIASSPCALIGDTSRLSSYE